ncbi:hypothetical protein [uncultured Dialister sp.]|uniref:hypothetical protein n=1 Tax=uncultured Dialister sp. TaxID=278064 RepID=UPI0025EE04D6|nr:hypothetical protein [uncultured Dialister sp.]
MHISKKAACAMAVAALCTFSLSTSVMAADSVINASEVNISVKGGSRGLVGAGITPGKVYNSADGWNEKSAADTNSVAIGGGQNGSMSSSASVRGKNSVALGAGADVDVSNSNSDFESANATALGGGAQVKAKQGTAVGYGSKVTGDQGTAFGEQSSAEAAGAAAFGEGSHAKATKSTALGVGADVETGADDSIALGAGSTVYKSDLKSTDTNGVVSVGAGSSTARRIIHVADGATDTDAATVGQMNTAIATAAKTATQDVDDITMKTTDALDHSTETRSFKKAGLVPGKSNSNYSTAIGNTGFGDPSVGTNSSMSVSIGDVAEIGDNAERSTAIGYNSNIAEGAQHSVAIGESSKVQKQESIAVGKSSEVDTQNGVAIGTKARISSGAVNSVAIGGLYEYDSEGGLGGGGNYMVAADAKNSTVVGAATQSSSEGGTAIGEGARVGRNASDSVALGHKSSVNASDIMASDTNGVVSFGMTKSSNGKQVTRRLINVADGINDTDGATVGQVKNYIHNINGRSAVDAHDPTTAVATVTRLRDIFPRFPVVSSIRHPMTMQP